MRKRINKPIMQTEEENKDKKNLIPLSYPASEDIYNKSHEETDINPENISENKIATEHNLNEEDVPGSELDDAQEIVGSEDEENNYYSIGGDRHEDLEETKVD